MNTIAKLFLVAAVAASTLAAVSLLGRRTEPTPVERGRYLVHTTGCNDCHTPWHMGPQGPEPDMSRLLSGHPADFELAPLPPASPGWMMHAAPTNTAWRARGA